jgi:hypothetical protein
MEKLFFVLGAITMTLFLSFLLSWPAYMLWNGCLVGAVNGVNEITWLQGWGLCILFNIMVKNSISKKD